MCRRGSAIPSWESPLWLETIARQWVFGNPWGAACYCYIKMSWGNCSVKVSSSHGDFHDEPEGVAPRRTGDCGRSRPDQQSGGSRRPAHDAPAISAAQAALSRDGGGGAAPPNPRAPLAAAPAGERGGPSPGAAARPLRG